MTDDLKAAEMADVRINALVTQAFMNVRSHDCDPAIAIADLMCAFILICRNCEVDPQRAFHKAFFNLDGSVAHMVKRKNVQ